MARIRHLAIVSGNRERLVEFYTKAFGMKRIESTGPAIYLTDGYINLALIQKRPHNKEGLYHFGFVVDDIEALNLFVRSWAPPRMWRIDLFRRRPGCTTPMGMASMSH